MAVNRRNEPKAASRFCQESTCQFSGMAKNWDLAIASSALLLIVGGLAAPHVRRLFAGDEANAVPADS